MSTGATSLLGVLIYLIVPIVMLVAGIVAHRGKSFWATWLMLIGSIMVFLAICLLGGALYFIIQNTAASISSPSPGTSSRPAHFGSGVIFSLLAGFSALGGFACYSIGLIGLCVRWGPTARRAAELEELTSSLLSERNQERL